MKPTSSKPTSWLVRQRAGWTFMEMMVAMACGSIILAAFVATTVTISNTMVAVSNYNDLNKTSRLALDRFSRDVRNASAVGSSSTATTLILTNNYAGTTLIAYSWDGSNVVTRASTANGVTTSDTVLKNCEAFSMNYYQRNPTNNFNFITSAIPAQIKLVSVSWRCSRTVLGSKLNTESVQTASVVMRN